ncbi:MAG: hypothetical protein KDK70_44335, partial [Myxococcales bacterium]|nr:hypothetical protein [Myxococcales bacterium]
PFTSFLALESESAYRRQGVERRHRPWDYELLGAVLPSQWTIEPDRRDPFATPDAGELLIGALTAPLGCSAKDEAEMAIAQEAPPPSAAMDERMDDEAGGQGQRHKGEEGRMGRPSSANKQGLYAMDGKDAPAGEPEPEEAMAMEEADYDDAPAMVAPKPTDVFGGGGGGGGGAETAKEAKGYGGGDDGGEG